MGSRSVIGLRCQMILKAYVFNLFLLAEAVPEWMFAARTVLIPKVSQPTVAADFRPISIASVVLRHCHKRAFVEKDGVAENSMLLAEVLHASTSRGKPLYAAAEETVSVLHNPIAARESLVGRLWLDSCFVSRGPTIAWSAERCLKTWNLGRMPLNCYQPDEILLPATGLDLRTQKSLHNQADVLVNGEQPIKAITDHALTKTPATVERTRKFRRTSPEKESGNSSVGVLVQVHQIHQIFRPVEPIDKPVQPDSTKRLIFEHPIRISVRGSNPGRSRGRRAISLFWARTRSCGVALACARGRLFIHPPAFETRSDSDGGECAAVGSLVRRGEHPDVDKCDDRAWLSFRSVTTETLHALRVGAMRREKFGWFLTYWCSPKAWLQWHSRYNNALHRLMVTFSAKLVVDEALLSKELRVGNVSSSPVAQLGALTTWVGAAVVREGNGMVWVGELAKGNGQFSTTPARPQVPPTCAPQSRITSADVIDVPGARQTPFLVTAHPRSTRETAISSISCSTMEGELWKNVTAPYLHDCEASRAMAKGSSQKQPSDTHKTLYDRVKRCRERKINIKASERISVVLFTQNKRPLAPEEVAYSSPGSCQLQYGLLISPLKVTAFPEYVGLRHATSCSSYRHSLPVLQVSTVERRWGRARMQGAQQPVLPSSITLIPGCTDIFPDPGSNDPSSDPGSSLTLVPI
ncbi:hypothetical protein PR048_006972 [Dryococelus australis]|uniref:Uncharacterized protein n=1 Tax=Dryococelus australis TaxID=614101 RepID=A0ABQ9ICF1_9NEOP|nr:hypothetical protein PR048_006972 [Dryococelus australis]